MLAAISAEAKALEEDTEADGEAPGNGEFEVDDAGAVTDGVSALPEAVDAAAAAASILAFSAASFFS